MLPRQKVMKIKIFRKSKWLLKSQHTCLFVLDASVWTIYDSSHCYNIYITLIRYPIVSSCWDDLLVSCAQWYSRLFQRDRLYLPLNSKPITSKLFWDLFLWKSLSFASPFPNSIIENQPFPIQYLRDFIFRITIYASVLFLGRGGKENCPFALFLKTLK